jgi:hypothetical protein
VQHREEKEELAQGSEENGRWAEPFPANVFVTREKI